MTINPVLFGVIMTLFVIETIIIGLVVGTVIYCTFKKMQEGKAVKELDVYLELYIKGKSIDENIEEINALLYSPKVQDLSGMPKGSGGTDSIVDKLVEKKEKLQNKRYEIERQKFTCQQQIDEMMNKCNLTRNEKLLIKYRFFYGLSWKRVGEELDWNENKVFRVYRKINTVLSEYVTKL